MNRSANLLKDPGFCWDELEYEVTFTTTESSNDLQTFEKPGFGLVWRDCTLSNKYWTFHTEEPVVHGLTGREIRRIGRSEAASAVDPFSRRFMIGGDFQGGSPSSK